MKLELDPLEKVEKDYLCRGIPVMRTLPLGKGLRVEIRPLGFSPVKKKIGDFLVKT